MYKQPLLLIVMSDDSNCFSAFRKQVFTNEHLKELMGISYKVQVLIWVYIFQKVTLLLTNKVLFQIFREKVCQKNIDLS